MKYYVKVYNVDTVQMLEEEQLNYGPVYSRTFFMTRADYVSVFDHYTSGHTQPITNKLRFRTSSKAEVKVNLSL
jgi:hypothetical protein